MSRFREGRLRFFNHDPSGPHVVRDIIDHVIVTVADFVESLDLTGVVNGYIGDVKQFTATAFNARGVVIDGAAVTWRSDNPTIVSITSAGVASFLASGSANITASVDARDYATTAVISQAPDGSIADVRFAIGDANFVGFWDYLTNVTTDGAGHTVQVDDARGVGIAPPLLGNGATKPAYDAVNGKITTDGVQNYLAPALDERWGLANNRTRTVVYLGDCTLSDFAAGISVNGGGPTPYLLLHVGGTLADLSLSPGVSPSGVEGTTAQAAWLEAVGATIKLWILEQHAQEGSTGTLTWNASAYQMAGRLRHVNTGSGNPGASASANSVLSTGNVPPQSPDFGHTNSLGKLELSCVLTAPMRQAIQRWAVRRAGSTALVTAKNGIITIGDSTTAGTNASSLDLTYPAQLQAQLTSYEVSNRGTSNRTIVELATGTVWQNQALADRDSTQRAKDWIVLWAGTNDIASGASPSTITPLYQSLCDQALAAGFRVLVLTCMKRGAITGTNETNRQTFNASVLTFAANGHATAVYDVASEPNLSDPTNVTYFADQTHPTAAGYTVVKTGVAAAILAAGG